MFKLLNIVAVALALIFSFGMYQLKYQTGVTNREVNKLKDELTRERELVHVLRAEWSYLNRAERIQSLADQYLPDLKPVTPLQLTDITDIPFRPLTLEDLINAQDGGGRSSLSPATSRKSRDTSLPRGGNANG